MRIQVIDELLDGIKYIDRLLRIIMWMLSCHTCSEHMTVLSTTEKKIFRTTQFIFCIAQVGFKNVIFLTIIQRLNSLSLLFLVYSKINKWYFFAQCQLILYFADCFSSPVYIAILATLGTVMFFCYSYIFMKKKSGKDWKTGRWSVV